LKKKINAFSFTPKYDEKEDRLRISINYDDLQNRIDFMMTRSFVLKLFPTLEDYMFKFYEVAEVPQVISQENIQKNIKEDKTTSMTDGSNLELYKQEDELLLEVQFSYVKNTKMTIVKFHSQNSEAIAQLDANSLKQIFSIIKSTIPFFSWGISHNL